MPDFSQLTPVERANLLPNWQGSQRRAAMWVDWPVSYEHQRLLDPLGIMPFPGGDDFSGVTPLWIQGSFISQDSQYPLATWEWISFLTHQRPAPRLIPARPSVAERIDFWENLPPQLAEAMRFAFPNAYPVRIEDQTAISWAQLSDIITGKQTPLDAAYQRPEAPWFGGVE